MPGIPIRVRVLLYPDQAGREPRPCPADVTIQLKRKGTGARTTHPVDLRTAAGGVTSPRRLAEGTYQVNITDPRFTLWEAADLEVRSRPTEAAVVAVAVAGDESATEAEKEAIEAVEEAALEEAEAAAETEAELRDVRLVPQAGRRHVVIRLVTPDGQPVSGGTVRITAANFDQAFKPCSDGNIYAVSPMGTVMLTLESVDLQGQRYCPQAFVIPYTVSAANEVKPLDITYWPAIQIVARPTVTDPDKNTSALYKTSVTVNFQVRDQDSGFSRTRILTADDANGEVRFEYSFPGTYTITVTPPPAFNGLPIQPLPALPPKQLSAGLFQVPADFTVVPTEPVSILVTAPDQPVTGKLEFEIYNGNTNITVPANTAALSATTAIPANIPVKIRLAADSNPMVGTIPLQMSTPGQAVHPGKTNTVVLEYEHSLTINAVDEQGRPVPGAMVDVYCGPDQAQVATVVVDAQGSFVLGLEKGGTYYLSEHTVGGQSQRRETVPVNSNNVTNVTIHGNRGIGSGDGEAVTDLSAYPVLTEEVSTLGGPAPAARAPGAGYGQTVDQVMRDVLGWRPSADVAGFQAALTGAFPLRQVEGHTEWSWQQRGYAVQADMGALTGAQASIYARAKNALDQIQPLLAGLTALNPSLYEPQDLETIRIVVSTELQELVTELALAGGPRIQRVDELFRLLVGENRRSLNINPDLVQGQLGILRQRFGLTRDEVQTVDEERIVTNFRIIVEQVLALQASWNSDRKLLSGLTSKTSLGTLLIRISRSLEAVCESVNDLTFSLDSVYVDAAQRQVVELRFADLRVKDVPEVPLRGNPPQAAPVQFGPHEAPIFLADLLDWVVRASKDEGPKMIQDAGKQGIFAFQPVLNTLRTLIRATGQVARERDDLPAGMRTPRVGRAIKVLAAQLDEAANLASLVRADLAPQVASASISDPAKPTIEITLTGSNFRPHAKAVLIVEDREDVPDQVASTNFNTPSSISATFTNPAYQSQKLVHPGQLPKYAGTTWLVSVINDDETQSVPIEVLRVPRTFAS